jgi:glycosyltransferase involved in cell wall biosynthesis
MIVKNEEEYIEACLESVKNLVDEIIILDTGSTDRTMEICSSYTDKIYETEWQEDFSLARNQSIDKATCDWILWMDADERLILKDHKLLQQKLSKKRCKAYSVRMMHFMDSMEEKKNQYYISHHIRLFQRKAEFRFQGIIHEKLVDRKGKELQSKEIAEVIELHHYGYTELHLKEKGLRNLSLCLKAKENDKENPWLDYHIAAELYRLGDMKKSLEFINFSILGFLSKGKVPPSYLYKLKYDLLITCGNTENVYEGIERAISLFPDYVELHFYRGIVLFRLNQYKEAVKAFSYCILLGEDNPNYLIKCGSGTFLAYYYIGEAYIMLGEKEYALEAYRQAVLYQAEFPEVQERLREYTA